MYTLRCPTSGTIRPRNGPGASFRYPWGGPASERRGRAPVRLGSGGSRMLSVETLFLLGLFGIGYWFWNDHLRVREQALRHSKRYCASTGMQWLDQTVGIHRLRLVRGQGGQLLISRIFEFEFSSDGADRRIGQLVMIGQYLDSVFMDLPAGPTYLDRNGSVH